MSTVSGQPSGKPCITFKNTSAAKNDAPSRKYCPSGTQGPAKDIKIGNSTLPNIISILKLAKNTPAKISNAQEALKQAWLKKEISDQTYDLSRRLLDYQTNITPTTGAPNNAEFNVDAFRGLAKATADNGLGFIQSVLPDNRSIKDYDRSFLKQPLDNNANVLSEPEIVELTLLDADLSFGDKTRVYEAFLQYGLETK